MMEFQIEAGQMVKVNGFPVQLKHNTTVVSENDLQSIGAVVCGGPGGDWVAPPDGTGKEESEQRSP